MKNLAIIPARGGSKRIPGKNIRPFLGKPIISYTIEAARQSGLFSEIMVSTDDEIIAQIASDAGAAIPFLRSKKNADDFAPLVGVTDEVIDEYKKEGISFNHICCMLPTSPLINPGLLQQAYSLLTNEDFYAVWPLVKFSYPVQKAMKIRNNKAEMFYPDLFMKRTQDFEPAYHDAGMFYFFKGGYSMMDSNRGAIVLDEMYVQDIDTETDWRLAELKYQLMYPENRRN